MLFLAALYNFHIQAYLLLSCNIPVNLYPTRKLILGVFEVKSADFMPLL